MMLGGNLNARPPGAWSPQASECEAIMSKAKSKEYEALVKKARELLDEAGCMRDMDGEEVLAETLVPEAKEYIAETIDDPEALYDPEIWDRPGFTLVLSWLAQKWHQKCQKLAPRVSKTPEQYLTKEQQKVWLDSAAAELTREIAQRRPLN
jgi:hypothetical protein